MGWFLLAFFALLVGSASSQLTTWDNQLFDFGWDPYVATVVRCSTLGITWNDRATANPSSTAPYTVSVLQGGYRPITIGTSSTHAYSWTVGLPTGGPYVLVMDDARGYTGGTSLVFNVVGSGGATCTSTSPSANSLQLTTTGTNAECSKLIVTAQGGSAPYTMQITVGVRPPKTSTWLTSTMSYTIDVQSGEQFFVVVTDANGLTAVEGIHTVTSGDTSCYGVAATVTVGATATTLSYEGSNTVSTPSSTSSPSTSRVIQNTGTTTAVTVIGQADGSSQTITLPPGESATIAGAANPNATTTQPSQTNSTLPAIIGGAVGGAALLVIALIALLWHRRQSNQVVHHGGNNDYNKQAFPLGGPQSMVYGAHNANPYAPYAPYTPPSSGHDTGPHMAHVNSMYSSSGSATTSPPDTHGVLYFGNNNHLPNSSNPEAPPPWATPTATVVGHGSLDATNYAGSSSAPGSSLAASRSLREGIPSGAMVPQLGGGRTLEKATFTSSKSQTPAPPYSHGG